MGLDMYLYLRKNDYHSGVRWKPEEERKKAKYPRELKTFELSISERNFTSVSTKTDYQIGYWRKSYEIHDWIIQRCGKGIDECQEIYISEENLQYLLDYCNTKIANLSLQKSKSESEEIACEEFVYTKELLEKTLNFLETDKGSDYQVIYRASW